MGYGAHYIYSVSPTRAHKLRMTTCEENRISYPPVHRIQHSNDFEKSDRFLAMTSSGIYMPEAI